MDRRHADGKGKRPLGMASMARPPPSYTDETLTERIAKEMRLVIFKLVQKMHDGGRLSTTQEIPEFLDQTELELICGQCDSQVPKEEAIKRFLLNFPLIFYVGDAEVSHRFLFVALSRDSTYYNPRFAIALSEVYDDDLESPLLWQGDGKPPYQRPDGSAPEYTDYLLAKASIAVLRVLDVLERSMKNGSLPWTAVEGTIPSIKRRLGPLGEALVWYCSTDRDFETGLLVFFHLIEGVFKVDDPAITLDAARLKAIWIATETDLLWSYTAVCLIRGVPTVTEMVEKLRCFVRLKRFRYDRIINEQVVNTQLKYWHPGLFLPGDGTIHRVTHSKPSQDDQMDELKELFTNVVQRSKIGGLSYKSCRGILERRSPSFKDWDVCKSSANIAANLCRTGSFIIDKGTIKVSQSAAAKAPRVNLTIGNLNIEVPKRVTPIGNFHDRLPPKLNGIITEIGLRSAIVVCGCCNDKCRKKLSSYHAQSLPDRLVVFCHIEETTLRGDPIEDFRLLFDVGDHLQFTYVKSRTPHVRRPCYITATNIACVLRRADDVDDCENAQVAASGNDFPVHRSQDSAATSVQPGWRKRLLDRKKKKKKNKKNRNGQGRARRRRGMSTSSSDASESTSPDSLPATVAQEDQPAEENEGACGGVGDEEGIPGLLATSSSDSGFLIDVGYLPSDADPNEMTLVSRYMIPECPGLMKLRFEGEFMGFLSQSFEEKLTLSTPSAEGPKDENNDDDGAICVGSGNIEESIRAAIVETMVRCISWLKVLLQLGCSEQQLRPSGYSPKNNDSWIINMAWDAITELVRCFSFSNTLSSMIDLLMSPSPVYLMELSPIPEGAQAEEKKEDDDDDDDDDDHQENPPASGL